MAREGTLYLAKNPRGKFFLPSVLLSLADSAGWSVRPWWGAWWCPAECASSGRRRLREGHHVCRVSLRPDGEVAGGILRRGYLAVGVEE